MSYLAVERISISVSVLILLVPVILLECMNRQPTRTRKAKKTKYLMISVIVSNTAHNLSFALYGVGCAHCTFRGAFYMITKAISKGVNMFFLIHRAQLAQGMIPVLSKKWFVKILPAITAAVVIVFILVIIKSAMDSTYGCSPYQDWNSLQQCDLNNDDNDNTVTAILAIVVDVIITVSLTCLFVIPLYRVYSTDIGVLNANQLKQRKKLRDLLIWSTSLTLINQVTSQFILLQNINRSKVTEILGLIGLFDPAFNVSSSWFMITRNRQYLNLIFRHSSCCLSKEAPARQNSVALTDIATMSGQNSNNNGLHFGNQQSTSERSIQSTISPESAAKPDGSS